MILAMNTLKIVFVWIISIVFLFIKKLRAKTKQKTITTRWYNCIYTLEFTSELETQYFFYNILSSGSDIYKK